MAGRIVAALVVGLLLAFIAWDVGTFQLQRPQIGKLIAAATEEERNPPETIIRLLRVAYGQLGVAMEANMVMMRDPTNPLGLPERIKTGDWHLRRLLSWLCMKLHLSEREQITLVTSRSYMGRGMWVYSAASKVIFGRPLALLSLEEAATLVAIPPCANCFHEKRNGWSTRRNWLLSKLQTGH